MKKNKVRLEDLPTYEIVCEEDGTQGIRMVSLVKDPAIEVKGMYFSAEELETEKRYEFKTVGDKQIIVGPAMIPNKKILRRDQNDNLYYVYFTPQTIKMMVDKFNKENNNKSINVDHSNKMVDGFIQQNWIVEDPTYDKSRYYGFNLPVGTWFIEVKIEDEDFWMNDVKDDGKYGFSIEGMMGQELVEMESDINKLIDDLTDDEIIKMFGDILDIDTNKFVVEPKAGETEEEFISRCIGEEINSGYEKDQAAAICYTKWDENNMESESLSSEKISFDFDDTLTRKDIQDVALRYIESGAEVYIISARQDKEGMFEIADKLGIPHSNIFATGSNKDKVEKVKELNIYKHYENNAQVVKELGKIGELV